MIQDLDERTAALRSIAERFQLDLMLLFGSRAKARARADSDYDVAVLDLCHPLDDECESALAAELYRIFKTDAVDLVLLRRASPLLRRLAAREGLLVYERMPRFHRRYCWEASRRWADERKLMRYKDRRVERFLQSRGLA